MTFPHCVTVGAGRSGGRGPEPAGPTVIWVTFTARFCFSGWNFLPLTVHVKLCVVREKICSVFSEWCSFLKYCLLNKETLRTNSDVSPVCRLSLSVSVTGRSWSWSWCDARWCLECVQWESVINQMCLCVNLSGKWSHQARCLCWGRSRTAASRV